MSGCRFEIKVKSVGRYHCAVKFGANGWAYTFEHDDLHDLCDRCKLRVNGRPLQVDHELTSAEFWEVAGGRIRARDWLMLEAKKAEDCMK